eukprot:c17820_g1_i2.p1 GENE.c17820_g1_i2~~c17820_g1_i2.p1  ORF type:complete len:447 (+),score=92.79 c17820_g1_i2:29-1369(+)
MDSLIHDELSLIFLFVATILVFLMQAGFAMLEAGVVQRKNIKNILSKNVLDACIGVIAFWLVGFGFAFGCKDGKCHPFIGNHLFALDHKNASISVKHGYLMWFFQFSFAATSTTVVSGCVAERMSLWGYCLVALCMTAFIYPVVAHWIFAEGWLHFRMIDIAGGTVVHMVGGTCGFVGALIVGPRVGRFQGSRFHVRAHEFPSFSSMFGSLGVMLLWFSWYGFNAGSLFPFVDKLEQVQLAVVNTTLSPAAAIVSSILMHAIPTKFRKVPLKEVLNACLAGLVAVTPCCGVVLPCWAICIGTISPFVYTFACWLLKQLLIDDPLDASPVHLFCGFWGVIATGLFSHPKHVRAAFPGHPGCGLIYCPDNPLLGWQLLGAAAVVCWCGVLSTLVFLTCKWLGVLRVSEEDERIGLDHKMHPGEDVGFSTAIAAEGKSLIARMVHLASA